MVIANRDEHHARPSSAADFWSDRPQVLGGRDLLRGGTWLAFDRQGRFAAVTNYRDGVYEDFPRSRGDLATDYFSTKMPINEFQESLRQRQDQYAGFNFIFGQLQQTFHYHSNREEACSLRDGVYGVSNGSLDNAWPKVVNAKEKLRNWLQTPTEIGALFEILAERSQQPGEDPLAPTSSAFIVNSTCGTRASTCILIETGGRAVFEERRFDSEGTPSGSSAFDFAIAS